MREPARAPRIVRYRGLFAIQHYDAGGIRRRHSLGTADRPRAEAGFAEWKRHLSAAAHGGPSTVAGVYEGYRAEAEAEGKPAACRIADAWKRLKSTFGPIAPIDVTPALCRAYRLRRLKGEEGRKPVGDGTIHVELGYLRAALRFGAKRGWLAQPPHVPLPRKPAPREGHLTRDEARALLDAAVMPHVRLFIVLAIATAARSGALLELTWDRVDFERRRILLRDPERHATRKGRATPPINDMALKALEDARKGAVSEFVIEWGGKKMASVRKGIEAAARRAGVQCTPHVLRHTAAVWMAEEAVPMSEISQYLGHTSTAVTERIYARYSPDHLRRAAAALEF